VIVQKNISLNVNIPDDFCISFAARAAPDAHPNRL
jgi:hypothetical protein